MPVVQSFYEVGITCHNSIFREIATGNMSSRLMIPQAILENRKTGQFMMFQIESAHSWHYSLGANRARYYLQLGGMSQLYHAWNKVLAPGQSYKTVAVTVCGGSSLHDVLANMTRYRRQVKLDRLADRHLPVIYNEYMYCGRLAPHEALTRQVAPAVSKLGAEYYVIDCGWQTDVPGEYEIMYREFGEWYGYLHRNGTVSHSQKGSLWKGPYHLPRCMMLCEKILDAMEKGEKAPELL